MCCEKLCSGTFVVTILPIHSRDIVFDFAPRTGKTHATTELHGYDFRGGVSQLADAVDTLKIDVSLFW